MNTLKEKRQAIRHLLRERAPADAMAAHFAFHHPDEKTQLVLAPPDGSLALGYVAISRTGMDLFRPLVTLRLPPDDMEAGTDLIYAALQPETAVFLHAPAAYLPLLRALFSIQTEEHLGLYTLQPARFQPVINVLVARSVAPNGLPRFVVRSDAADNQVVAAASLNWQSPHFAEIGVTTQSRFRRRGWGRSVVAAMAQYVLENGRLPLYAVSQNNLPSIRLAEDLGFVDSGLRFVMMQAVLRPRP